ncbi:fatty acid oxidation complex subunit alpha FadJ [Vibrio tritonius]|uniref:fatty acid oxidation complex subunit alpha FadJ n=1 Tax=Vibrio tritonius TaxID=1435069 RepID=UPI00315D3696
MTEQSGLQFSIDNHSIAWLCIDVPNEKMNTLKRESIVRFEEILAELEAQQSRVKGLVIYSAKDDNFVAGADVNMIDACSSASEAQAIAARGQQLFGRIEALPFPSVAAIHGTCLGGGLELALACDYRICSEENITVLGLPEVKLGLLPGSGGTQRLPRLIGLLPALEMILSGKTLVAKKALKLGVVDAIVAHSVLLDVAQRWLEHKRVARQLPWLERVLVKSNWIRHRVLEKAQAQAFKKGRGNYPAVDAILDVIRQGSKAGFEKGLEAEAAKFGELVMTPESQALRKLFFATTQLKKEQQGKSSDGGLTHALVLGGGFMGAGISYVSAHKAGMHVRIKDIANQGVASALRYAYQRLQTQKKRGKLNQYQVRNIMSRLSGGTEFNTLDRCQLVIEAVFEDVALKQQMVQEVEALTQNNANLVFASNTSSIPIHAIAAKAANPERIIGLHYFSPVDKMPLVEVVPHSTTSQDTIALAVSFARRQGKTPIVVKDSAGFYVNRILAPYMNEAAQLMMDGEPIDEIDQALVNFGFPVGPITLLDEVGIDIGAKVIPNLVENLGARFSGPDIFEPLLASGRLGRKAGKGFYVYRQGERKEVDRKVYRMFGLSSETHLTPKTISLRCLLPMLNEAARCLDEQVIASARDGDVGAIFGIGFPPFLGGPFSYMDRIGLPKVIDIMNRYSELYGARFAPYSGLLDRAGKGEKFY